VTKKKTLIYPATTGQKKIIIISDLLIHTLDLWINTVSPSKNELTRTFLDAGEEDCKTRDLQHDPDKPSEGTNNEKLPCHKLPTTVNKESAFTLGKKIFTL
jgi:hypothetical protein